MYYKIKANYLDIRKVLKGEYTNLEENKSQNEVNLPKEENKNEMPEEKQEEVPQEAPQEMPKQRLSKEKEAELMRELYTEINKALYPFILQTLNEYEFNGSILYNESGIDRETISQMVDRVINLAEENLDTVGEIKLNRAPDSIKYWDSWALLRSTIEALLLNDIFGIRRAEYLKMIDFDF